MRFLPASPWLAGGVAAFLWGCTRGQRPLPVAPASTSFFPREARDEEAPPRDAARVTLLPELPSQESTLRDARGEVLCALPCTAWVRPGSRLRIEVHEEGVFKYVDVPYALAANGESATAVVEPERGHPGAAIGLGLGSVAPIVLGSMFIAVCEKNRGDNVGGDGFCLPGIGLTAIGVGLLVTAVVLGANSRRPRIEVVAPSP